MFGANIREKQCTVDPRIYETMLQIIKNLNFAPCFYPVRYSSERLLQPSCYSCLHLYILKRLFINMKNKLPVTRSLG